MAFCKLDFFAESLDVHTTMNVLLPDKGKGPFGVLYLLHGLGNTKEAWCKWTSLPRYHRDQPLIIVMPDASIGWYCNDGRAGCHAWEDHIIKDVVPTVDRLFPTITKRSGRVIAGMSMGGYGAIMLALKHSKLFCGASGHASAFFFTHEFSRSRPQLDSHAEAIGMNGDYDIFKLAAEAATAGHLPKLRFDCGQNDPLLTSNRKFHEHLESLNVPHEYAEPAGIHDWAFGDQQIPETIKFAQTLFGA